MKSNIFKSVLSVFLAAILLFVPASLSFAAAENGVSGSVGDAPGNAEIKSRDEVIYAVLTSEGGVRALYAVNHFTFDRAGTVTDYGEYTAVKNLTDTSPIAQKGGAVTLKAGSDHFYYQGNMTGTDLPWTFDISYFLDGVKVSPEKLAGESGKLEIHIKTKQNNAVNPSFFENYMLQISITLNTLKCDDIKAPGAAVARAGENKIIAYTVMPGKEADISVSASVKDFTMTGIALSAMPFSINMELPDMGGMIDDFTELSRALSDLDDGVGELADGMAELAAGAGQLTNGSSAIKDGLSGLNAHSEQLMGASAQISASLSQIVSSLDKDSKETSWGDLAQLPHGLSQLADGLDAISGGLTELKNGFAPAYSALDIAMQGIPDTAVSREQIAALYDRTEASQHGLLDQLAASYMACQTVKGTYNQVKDAFGVVETAMDTLSASTHSISTALDDISAKITDALSGMDLLERLSAGLSELDRNYAAFHIGMKGYTDGVGELSSGFTAFHDGVSSFAVGVGKLYDGTAELRGGTGKLSDETAKMPDQIQTEIDGMLGQYTDFNFEPISFASPKNERTELVQFVLKCDGILKPEENNGAVIETRSETFWDRLIALFTGKRGK